MHRGLGTAAQSTGMAPATLEGPAKHHLHGELCVDMHACIHVYASFFSQGFGCQLVGFGCCMAPCMALPPVRGADA